MLLFKIIIFSLYVTKCNCLFIYKLIFVVIESPPISEKVAPPKKRRLPRVSLSNDNSPPTTPTNVNAPVSVQNCEDTKACPTTAGQEGRVEIVYSGTEGDSPTQVLESDAVLKERAAEMQQEFGACIRLSESRETSSSLSTTATTTRSQEMLGIGNCLVDPRLSRNRGGLFSNSEHLVGTVEKTLSFLGFEDRKMENHLPAKRKVGSCSIVDV